MVHQSQRGYNGYRGRRTLTDFLKIAVVALGVIALLLLAVLWMTGGEKKEDADASVQQSSMAAAERGLELPLIKELDRESSKEAAAQFV